MTSSPTLPDPYEAVMVQVKQSKVEGANEGIFARKNTEKAINFNKNDLQHIAQNLHNETCNFYDTCLLH